MKIVEYLLMRKAAKLGNAKQMRLPKLNRVRLPSHIERRYYTELKEKVISRLQQLMEQYFLPHLIPILNEAIDGLPRNDSVRFDDYSRDIDTIFSTMRTVFARELNDDEIASLAQKYAKQTEKFNGNQLFGNTEKVLGVTPTISEPYLVPIMREFVSENTELIRSISDKFFSDIKRDTYRHIQQGVYNKEYAKKIKAQYEQEFYNQYRKGILKKRVTNADARAKLIARDQISKYNGQLNQTRQTALGISLYRWSTVGDGRVRDSHKALNGKVFSWNNPPVINGRRLHPGDDYQCFPAETSVDLCFDAIKGFRRWYNGKLTTVITDTGESFRCTPNHPFLTDRGWVAAKDLQETDYLIKISDKALIASKFDVYKTKSFISNKFRFLGKLGIINSIGGAFGDFHGDGTKNKIDIVFTNRELMGHTNPIMNKARYQFDLAKANSTASTCSNLFHCGFAFDSAFRCIMRILRQCQSLFGRKFCHSDSISFAGISDLDAIAIQNAANWHSRYTKFSTDSQFTDTGFIQTNDLGFIKFNKKTIPVKFIDARIDPNFSQFLAQAVRIDADSISDILEHQSFGYERCGISKVFFSEFSGHVFNLETKKGWYLAEGFITKNCRCIALPIFGQGVTDNPKLLKLLNS